MKNKTMIQLFEWYLPADQLYWRQCISKAKSLADMGITAAWLPPAYKGSSGNCDVGYGVYDTYDLGEFNQKGTVPTKYGTKEEYLKAVKNFQDNGIEVLADIVLNHRIGADETEKIMAVCDSASDRNVQVGSEREITAYTKFTFPGRNGTYSDFQWNWKDFDGTDWDEDYKYKGIFQFVGKTWEADTDNENGNYDFLMGADLDLSSPRVIAELKNWGKWYMDTVHMDGFRLDAVKHMSVAFYTDWLKFMRNDTKKDLFAVGEYWSPELGKLINYLDECGYCMTLFDAPLHYRLKNASEGHGQFDMGSIFNDTLVKEKPESAVTFIDNHDTQPGQALTSWIEEWFRPLAYALILLRKDGYPCIFYGDLYGLPHDNVNAMVQLPMMIKARELYAYGEQHDYFDHTDIIGWTREGDGEHSDSGMAVILSDGSGGKKTMYMNKALAGQQLYDCMQHIAEPVTIDETGSAEFTVSGGSVSVWVTKKAYEYLTVEFVPYQ